MLAAYLLKAWHRTGPEKSQEVKDNNASLMITVADSMLTRDKLDSALRQAQAVCLPPLVQLETWPRHCRKFNAGLSKRAAFQENGFDSVLGSIRISNKVASNCCFWRCLCISMLLAIDFIPAAHFLPVQLVLFYQITSMPMYGQLPLSAL